MAKSNEKKKKKRSAAEIEEEKEEEVENPVKIKVIDPNPQLRAPPIIGYFPSGYDPLKPTADNTVTVYKNTRANPKTELAVGVNGSKLNFVGNDYSGEAATQQMCTYALGVFDKETGVLKMVPVAGNRILRLVPRIGDYQSIEDEEAKEGITKEEKDDKLRNLNTMYSTKKNIRRDAKRETLRLTEDPGTQKDMDTKLKRIKINTEELEDLGPTQNALNIPPYDLEATAPDMVYPLNKIILEGEWDYLLDLFNKLAAEPPILEVKPADYPSFVCNRFNKLRNVKDESKKKRMAAILSYLTHLIKFKDKHSMDGVTSAKHHIFPSILSHKFSSMFGSENERRIPVEKQQLLINYILVLSLIADDFRSDISDIAKDLRIKPMTLRDHYKYLGCKLVLENQITLATLPLPLKFESIKRKRGRR